MFDDTLGYWDTDTVGLELNPDYKLFNCKYYTVPKINKDKFHKDLELLVKMGVLTPVQQSQYGTPLIIIPKKEGTVRFITYYFRINRKLVINMYPLPRIGETMHKLEGLHYATTLDLNMGYNNIRLSPTSQDMATVVTEFGKFIYNCLRMVMCASGDIFQAKVDDLLVDIEGVKHISTI